MARIEEFEAKDVKLTPSDKGYAAVEMAARRIGPLYGQMAAGARELGNLTKGSDEAIGRTAEAFLRFEGLSNQAGNAGVKVGKGGAERTLLGTGAGGDTSWNARANASNDLTERKQAASADTALLKDKIEAGKAQAVAQSKLDADKLEGQLKSGRDAEDEQKKAQRDQAAADLLQERTLNKANDPDWYNSTANTTAMNKEDARIKQAHDTEDAQIKQARDRQDTQIKQAQDVDAINKAAIDYKTKVDFIKGGPALSVAARAVSIQNNVAATDQAVSNDVQIQRGGVPNTRRAQQIGAETNAVSDTGTTPRPGGSFEKTLGEGGGLPGEAASTGDAGPDTFASGYDAGPTYLGDNPAIPSPPQQPTAASQETVSQPGGYAQEVPSQPQDIQSPIDQASAPALYSDMTGGM